MQVGAYITDGVHLYEVTGLLRGPGMMGVSAARLTVENCRHLTRREFFPEKIRTDFELVRPAPIGACPDIVDDIAWEPAAAVPGQRAA
jgi:hypothetical protein